MPTAVLIIGGLLLLAAGSGKLNAVERLSYRPKSIRVMKRGFLDYLLNIPLQITLEVFNQTRTPLSFQALTGELIIKGDSFAFNARAGNSGTIPAFGSTTLKIDLNVGTLKALNIIKGALAGEVPKKARLKGMVYFEGGLSLPVDADFDFFA